MKIYCSQSDQSILDWQWLEPSLRNITKIIIKNLPQRPGKALDVGCGTGRISFQLASCGFEVDGIDQEKRVIDLANQISAAHNLKCYFRLGDFRDPIEVVPNHYDLIVCSEVLEHVVDYKSILENIYRSLKSNGRFILTVPYDPKKFSVLDEYGGHVRRFSYDQVINDLLPYRNKKIIITGFPFYRLLIRTYLFKIRFFGHGHSNEELWKRPLTHLIARLFYPCCRLDNLFSYSRLGDALIAIADK